MIKNKRILVLAPHTDDAEIGAGGFISKYINDNEIYCASFSFAEESIAGDFKKGATRVESRSAAKILGIEGKKLINFDYKVRYFWEERQNILENLIILKKEVNPDIVLTTSSFDTHQDHAVLRNETFRAFKDRTIFGYEMPNNNILFRADLLVKLDKKHIDKKIEAIKKYKSQLFKAPDLVHCVEGMARHRGYQVKSLYAEAFEVIRIVL